MLDGYVTMLIIAGRYAAGEIVWQKHLEHPVNDAQRKYFEGRLWYLYNRALEHHGEVSLGKGESLFNALIAYGLKQIDAATDENERYEAVNRLTQTFDIADRNQIPGVKESLRKFAFEQIPEILKRQQSAYGTTAVDARRGREAIARSERRLAVHRRADGAMAATSASHQRKRVASRWQSRSAKRGGSRRCSRTNPRKGRNTRPWSRACSGWSIAELKQYLLTGESSNQSIFYNNSSPDYWNERADDFAQAANEVREEQKHSGGRMLFIAQYFRDGLGRRGRAIEVLLIANAAGLLDDAGQQQLGDNLQEERRYAESIPIFEPLVKWKPDNMDWRIRLMRAYHESHRPEQLIELVSQTDKYFHAERPMDRGEASRNSPTPVSIATSTSGRSAISTKRFRLGNVRTPAADSATRRSPVGMTRWRGRNPRSGIPKMPSMRHRPRSSAGAHVEVSDRRDQSLENRAKQRQRPRRLRQSPRRRSEEDGTRQPAVAQDDRPGLSRAESMYTQAIAQFDLARQLQPNDKETYQALIACYDALGQTSKATKQLLALVDFDRHDLKLYEQLADRMKSDEAEAERAATSIIEAGPSEAENHQALAELRQKQNRWDDAIDQWKEVAELRRLEPTGLLKLAEAEIHQKQWDSARQTLDKLSKTEWPSRFNIGNQIQQLRSMLSK